MDGRNAEDEIFIGNLGRYNEGELVGDWLSLPCEVSELPAWLENHVGVDGDHEETFIMDWDLSGPLGEVGLADLGMMGEWARPEMLNIAAKCAADLTSAQRGAVRAWADYAGCDAIETLCNYMLQADKIPYMRLDGDRLGYSSKEERLAYTVLGGLSGASVLSDAELERHFDYESFGRLLDDDGMYLGEIGYLDPSCAQDLDLGLYGASEIIDMAKEFRWGPSSHASDPAAEDAFIASFGLLASEVHAAREADPALCGAVASYLEGMSEEEAEALRLFADAMLDPSRGPLDLMNAVLDLSNSGYREYTEWGRSAHERCARTFIAEYGMPSREELERYFDMGSYGTSLIEEGGYTFTADREGVITDPCDGPGDDLYSTDELTAMFSGMAGEPDGVDALATVARIAGGVEGHEPSMGFALRDDGSR